MVMFFLEQPKEEEEQAAMSLSDKDNMPGKAPKVEDMLKSSFEEVVKTGEPKLAECGGKVVLVVSRETECVCAHCVVGQGAHRGTLHSMKGNHHQHFELKGSQGSIGSNCVHKFNRKRGEEPIEFGFEGRKVSDDVGTIDLTKRNLTHFLLDHLLLMEKAEEEKKKACEKKDEKVTMPKSQKEEFMKFMEARRGTPKVENVDTKPPAKAKSAGKHQAKPKSQAKPKPRGKSKAPMKCKIVKKSKASTKHNASGAEKKSKPSTERKTSGAAKKTEQKSQKGEESKIKNRDDWASVQALPKEQIMEPRLVATKVSTQMDRKDKNKETLQPKKTAAVESEATQKLAEEEESKDANSLEPLVELAEEEKAKAAGAETATGVMTSGSGPSNGNLEAKLCHQSTHHNDTSDEDSDADLPLANSAVIHRPVERHLANASQLGQEKNPMEFVSLTQCSTKTHWGKGNPSGDRVHTFPKDAEGKCPETPSSVVKAFSKEHASEDLPKHSDVSEWDIPPMELGAKIRSWVQANIGDGESIQCCPSEEELDVV